MLHGKVVLKQKCNMNKIHPSQPMHAQLLLGSYVTNEVRDDTECKGDHCYEMKTCGMLAESNLSRPW